MKRILTLLLLFFLGIVTLVGQIPRDINYQAVIRDNNGNIEANRDLEIEISIRTMQDIFYTEKHFTTSNKYGIVTLSIGDGIVLDNTQSYEEIPWSQSGIFAEIRIDNGTGLKHYGDVYLKSVPYAIMADSALHAPLPEIKLEDLANVDASGLSKNDVLTWKDNKWVKGDSIKTSYLAVQKGAFIYGNMDVSQDLNISGNLNIGGVQVIKNISNDSTFSEANDSTLMTSKAIKLYVDNAAGLGGGSSDNDITNELQTISLSGDTIFLTDGGFIKLPTTFSGDYSDLSNKPTNLSDFNNDLGFITEDDDSDSTNEIQSLTLSNDTIYLTDGGFIKLPSGSIDTDQQQLSLSNDTIYLTNGGFIKLPSGVVDTDDQSLSLNGTDLSIEDGNTINLSVIDTDTKLTNAEVIAIIQNAGFSSSDTTLTEQEVKDIIATENYLKSIDLNDDDASNEIQSLTLSNDTIYLTDGGFIKLPSGTIDTDQQQLSLSNDTIYLTNGGFIKLPSGVVDTDDQSLSLSGTDLSIEDGNTIDLSVIDTDTKLTNAEVIAIIQNAGFSSSDTTLSEQEVKDIIATENYLKSIDLNDDDANNEIQSLTLSNDTIYLTDGGFIKLPSGTIDTDQQQLSLSNDTVYLTNGGFIKLPSGVVDTDDQTISLSGTDLSISEGNTIDISSIDTDTKLTDAEVEAIISAAGYSMTDTTLSELEVKDIIASEGYSKTDTTLTNEEVIAIIQNAGFSSSDTTLTEQEVKDIIATENYLKSIDLNDDDASNEIQSLTLSNDTIYLTNGGFIKLPSGSVDTDQQQLSLSNDTIYLTNGGFIKLPSGVVDTDDQTISLSGTDLSISEGNTIDISSIDTDTKLTDAEVEAIISAAGYSMTDTTLSELEVKDIIASEGYSKTDTTLTNEEVIAIIQNAGFSSSDTTLSAQEVKDIIATENYLKSIDLNDDDASNEIQSLSLSNDTIYLTDGGFIKLPSGTIDTDQQQLSLSNDTVYLTNGGFIKLPSGVVDTDDQTLSLSGTDLSISEGNSVNLSSIDTDTQLSESEVDAFVANNGYLISETDGSITNEIQDLEISGNNLRISNNPSATTIDLSPYLDDTDTQLSESEVDAFVADNGFLTSEVDGSITNEIQVLSISNDTIYLTNGGFIKLPSGVVDTDDQTISFNGTDLSISEGNSVNLSSIDTDTQLSESEVDAFVANNGYLTSEVDGSITNEIQVLSISNDTIYLSDGGFVKLPSGSVDTDDQSLSLNGTDLSIEDGNTIDLSSIDTDTKLTDAEVEAIISVAGFSMTDTTLSESEVKTIIATEGYSKTDTTLTNEEVIAIIQNAGFSSSDTTLTEQEVKDIIATENYLKSIDLNDDDASNEIQSLSLSNDTIYLTDGGFIKLPSGTIDTDQQQLSLSNDTIYLTNGGFIKLPSGVVDTDDQTISLSGTELSISEGNTIDISSIDTDTKLTDAEVESIISAAGYSMTDTTLTDEEVIAIIQNAGFSSSDTQLSESEVDAFVANNGYLTSEVDGSISNEIQALRISNDTIYLSDGGFVKLPSGVVDTDDQTLNLSGTDLSISEGNTIDLSSIDTDTDTQLSESEVDAFVANNGYLTSEVDGSITNEIQVLSISNDTIYLSDGGFVKLPSGSVDTDDQTLSLSGTDLSISEGNTIDISSIDTDTDTQLSESEVDAFVANNGYLTSEVDGSITNEIQVLSISNDTIYLSDGGFIKLPSGSVDTDDQTLSLSGTDLSISDGNSINISSINTDNQNLVLSGTELSIENGNSVDLSTISGSSIFSANEISEEITLETDYSGFSLNTPKINGLNYPTVDGELGQVLSTDGTGNLYWQELPTGGGNVITGNCNNNLNGANYNNGTSRLSLSFQSDFTNYQGQVATGDYSIQSVTYNNSTSELEIDLFDSGDGETKNIVFSSVCAPDEDKYDTYGAFFSLNAEKEILMVTYGNYTSDILAVNGSSSGESGGSQTLSLSGTDLSISDGNSVDLSSIDTDTDTQLSESEVDAFVANNGYLTSEVDGSITNELQTLNLSGNDLEISGGNSVDLSSLGGGDVFFSANDVTQEITLDPSYSAYKIVSEEATFTNASITNILDNPVFNGNPSFLENVSFQKDVTVVDSLTVQGNSYFDGDLSALGKGTLGNGLGVTGTSELDDINSSGSLIASGSGTFGTGLDVTGPTTLDNVTASGNGIFTGSLSVNGQALFNNGIIVNGTGDFNNNLNVDGTTTLDNTNIDGPVDIDGTLDVLNGTTLRGGANVTGTITATGRGSFGNLRVNGMDYPNSPGSAGQVLTTNSDGDLVWDDVTVVNEGTVTVPCETTLVSASGDNENQELSLDYDDDTKFEGLLVNFSDGKSQLNNASQESGKLIVSYQDAENVQQVITYDPTCKPLEEKKVLRFLIDLTNNNLKAIYEDASSDIFAIAEGGKSSDIRLKIVSDTLSGPQILDKLEALNSIKFTWKDRARGMTPEYGLIAQELQETFPEIVTQDSKGFLQVEDYSSLDAIMISAIKELKTEKETLQTENKDLKIRVAELEKQMKMLMQWAEEK